MYYTYMYIYCVIPTNTCTCTYSVHTHVHTLSHIYIPTNTYTYTIICTYCTYDRIHVHTLLHVHCDIKQSISEEPLGALHFSFYTSCRRGHIPYLTLGPHPSAQGAHPGGCDAYYFCTNQKQNYSTFRL